MSKTNQPPTKPTPQNQNSSFQNLSSLSEKQQNRLRTLIRKNLKEAPQADSYQRFSKSGDVEVLFNGSHFKTQFTGKTKESSRIAEQAVWRTLSSKREGLEIALRLLGAKDEPQRSDSPTTSGQSASESGRSSCSSKVPHAKEGPLSYRKVLTINRKDSDLSLLQEAGAWETLNPSKYIWFPNCSRFMDVLDQTWSNMQSLNPNWCAQFEPNRFALYCLQILWAKLGLHHEDDDEEWTSLASRLEKISNGKIWVPRPVKEYLDNLGDFHINGEFYEMRVPSKAFPRKDGDEEELLPRSVIKLRGHKAASDSSDSESAYPFEDYRPPSEKVTVQGLLGYIDITNYAIYCSYPSVRTVAFHAIGDLDLPPEGEVFPNFSVSKDLLLGELTHHFFKRRSNRDVAEKSHREMQNLLESGEYLKEELFLNSEAFILTMKGLLSRPPTQMVSYTFRKQGTLVCAPMCQNDGLTHPVILFSPVRLSRDDTLRAMAFQYRRKHHRDPKKRILHYGDVISTRTSGWASAMSDLDHMEGIFSRGNSYRGSPSYAVDRNRVKDTLPYEVRLNGVVKTLMD